ncbi:unnamed protein product [Parascedosporium putredinis]|uniref:Major facilitator superfamily (MFS) profile domain-containing protein n=1 Tax=Parascedosporium putredinis TaxID=1442378 RepID=A0A9P1H8S6_9PEZI|nr:unnamed protein product [Parascedosporium putredinis]CAI8002777.1 unnamed protein product [Parascedosporium putredinis]
MTTTQVLTATELSELPSLHGETPPDCRVDPIVQVSVPDSDPGKDFGCWCPARVRNHAFISNFTTVAGGFEFSEKLGREAGPGQANWLAAAYSLTQGAFVLISGRIGTIYGHQTALLCGGAIFTVFSFANAFCTNYTAFVAARALTGVGAAS